MTPAIQLVWFKRDLRTHDHAPLARAAERGPVLPLYIVEPSIIHHHHDFAPRHWTFIRESLAELREALAALGQPLVVRVGEAVDVLSTLEQIYPLAAMWAHEETGNGVSYARDRAVRRWAKAQNLPFTEIPQNGVVRRLPSRDEWAARWEARMQQPLAAPPAAITPLPMRLDPGPLPTHADLGLDADTRSEQQPGGETLAHDVLDSFLTDRGAFYHQALSSPLTAWDSCSRISPHLTWGTISIRQIVRATRARTAALQLHNDPAEQHWLRALSTFESRLHWHCHFIQKLEDEPAVEEHNFVRTYDGMREEGKHPEHLAAWAAGGTGYPFVDACMRALTATGWLNFRMRAMLVSFASYDLWLHWRESSHVLACRWIDYEPGIHYAQMQMQSGTTGINTLRIYNPIKQGQDHDPDGVFIRRWVPELAALPNSFIHTPWLVPTVQQEALGCRIGRDYPRPVVDHIIAVRAARARIAAVRHLPETQAAADAVQQRHGSRRPRPAPRPRKAAPKQDRNQLRLELE